MAQGRALKGTARGAIVARRFWRGGEAVAGSAIACLFLRYAGTFSVVRDDDRKSSVVPADKMTSPQIERAILSVSDKTGLVEFARELAAGGRRALRQRRHAAAPGRGRHPGPRRRRLHRLSRDDGWPAQDAAPQDPRRHPLPPRPARRHGRARRARHRAVRAGGGEPLSVRADDRPRGRDASTKRSSRSTSAGRRWSAGRRRIMRS